MKALVGIVLVLAGCAVGRGPSAPSTHTLTGDLAIYAVTLNQAGTSAPPCAFGTGGYSDILPGAQVSVYDGAGKVLGVGALGAATQSFPDAPHPTLGDCTFPFAVSAVPSSAAYSVEVSHRGKLNYTRAQLDADGWTVHMTL